MLANVYKRTRFSVWNVLGALVAIVVTSLVFSDLVAMAFHLRKIFKSVSLPFSNETVVVDEKKERVVEKVTLRSRSEIILDKYRKSE